MSRRDHARSVTPEERGESVAVADVEEPPRGSRGQHDLTLGMHGGAELHRRGQVHDEPRVDLMLDDRHAHVRLRRPGSDAPVDQAHVVALHVTAAVTRFTAGTRDEPLVVAAEQPVEPPGHQQFEAVQDVPAVPGALAGLRADAAVGGHGSSTAGAEGVPRRSAVAPASTTTATELRTAAGGAAMTRTASSVSTAAVAAAGRRPG